VEEFGEILVRYEHSLEKLKNWTSHIQRIGNPSQFCCTLGRGLASFSFLEWMKRHRVTNLYSGHVQGVGFRYTVKTLTQGFEVTGAVRNLEDGRVELSAEGVKEELEAFLEAIRQSEVGRFIRQEQACWAEAKNEFRGFEIMH
jgi:acylphosphatase